MHRGQGVQMNGDQGIPATGVVDRRDSHITRVLRLVDNSDESLPGRIGRRHERNGIGVGFRIRRKPVGDRPRGQHPRGGRKPSPQNPIGAVAAFCVRRTSESHAAAQDVETAQYTRRVRTQVALGVALSP